MLYYAVQKIKSAANCSVERFYRIWQFSDASFEITSQRSQGESKAYLIFRREGVSDEQR